MSDLLLPNTTQIPNVMLDRWMAKMEGGELKILLYVARCTFGFGKRSDAISYGQMATGKRRADGTSFDDGTGLSRRAVVDICAYLVECGALLQREPAPVNGRRPNVPSRFALNMKWDGHMADRREWQARQKAPRLPAKTPASELTSPPASELTSPPASELTSPTKPSRTLGEDKTPESIRILSVPKGDREEKSLEVAASVTVETEAAETTSTLPSTPAFSKPKVSRPPRAAFVPPTEEEAQAFFATLGRPDLAPAFLNNYTANGWVMGKARAPVKDWKALARNWKLRDAEFSAVTPGTTHATNASKNYASKGGQVHVPSAHSVTAGSKQLTIAEYRAEQAKSEQARAGAAPAG